MCIRDSIVFRCSRQYISTCWAPQRRLERATSMATLPPPITTARPCTFSVEIRCGVEVGRDVTLDDLRKQGYKAFYVAIGCQGGRKAGVPGEDAEGVTTAVEFLRNVCADETLKVQGRAVVIGGGNVAIDVARSSQIGRAHV